MYNFSWRSADFSFFESQCSFLLEKFHLYIREKRIKCLWENCTIYLIQTAKGKNVLFKKSCTEANFCSTLQNNLCSSTTLSLLIDFFSKLNGMSYLLQTGPVKSTLADQSVCLTTLAGGKNLGGSRCYSSPVTV